MKIIMLADLLHIMAGASICGLAVFSPVKRRLVCFVLLLVCLVVALSKEEFDSNGYGDACWTDFWLTMFAGVLASCWAWSRMRE